MKNTDMGSALSNGVDSQNTCSQMFMLTADVGACWPIFLWRGQRYDWLCMAFRWTGFCKVKLNSEV